MSIPLPAKSSISQIAAGPVYDARSHLVTIAAREAELNPVVDLFDLRDATGQDVRPMTVETRCLLLLINDDGSMFGDRS